MATAFENFVNTELPKRIATNESPTTPQAGDIPIYTGVGLLTESKTPNEVGIATVEQLNTKQNNLVSGTNIKTINSNSLLGSGNLVIESDVIVIKVASGTVTLAANKNYLILATGNFTLNADALTTGNVVEIKSLLDSVTSTLTVTFAGTSSYYSELGGTAITNATVYPASSLTMLCRTGGIYYRRTGVQFASEFMLRKDGNSSLRSTFSNSSITANRVITLPDATFDLGDLSFVAKTNGNVLSGTRTHIIGGQSNTVSGTDNTLIASNNCIANGTDNVIIHGSLCNTLGKVGTNLSGRKAIPYTDFENVDCSYFGTSHAGGARQYYDRFAPNIRKYMTYMFGDVLDLSVQNSFSLAFKPKAVIGLTNNEPAAALHKIKIIALKMGGVAGTASMEVSLMCRSESVGVPPYTSNNYFIVERVDSPIIGTAGIMGTFTFTIDSEGYLIIQKSPQTADWAYFIYDTAYHTAAQ